MLTNCQGKFLKNLHTTPRNSQQSAPVKSLALLVLPDVPANNLTSYPQKTWGLSVPQQLATQRLKNQLHPKHNDFTGYTTTNTIILLSNININLPLKKEPFCVCAIKQCFIVVRF
jgi:hypothetical protein